MDPLLKKLDELVCLNKAIANILLKSRGSSLEDQLRLMDGDYTVAVFPRPLPILGSLPVMDQNPLRMAFVIGQTTGAGPCIIAPLTTATGTMGLRIAVDSPIFVHDPIYLPLIRVGWEGFGGPGPMPDFLTVIEIIAQRKEAIRL